MTGAEAQPTGIANKQTSQYRSMPASRICIRCDKVPYCFAVLTIRPSITVPTQCVVYSNGSPS